MQEHCLLETAAARSVCVHVLKMPCFFFILKKAIKKVLDVALRRRKMRYINFFIKPQYLLFYLSLRKERRPHMIQYRGCQILLFSSNLKLDLSNTSLNSFLGTGGVCKTSLPHSSTVSRPLSPFSSCFSCFWGFLPYWAPRSSGASCPFASHKRITIRNCTRGRGAISTLFPQASSPFSRLAVHNRTQKLQLYSFLEKTYYYHIYSI